MNLFMRNLLNFNAFSGMNSFGGDFAGYGMDPMMLAQLGAFGGGWGGMDQMGWGHNSLRDMFAGHMRSPTSQLREGLEVKQQTLSRDVKGLTKKLNGMKDGPKKQALQKSLSEVKQAKNQIDMGLRSKDPAKMRDAILRSRNHEIKALQAQRPHASRSEKFQLDQHIHSYRMANLNLAADFAYV